jgi:DNA polymerase IIIc chi subunit
VLVNLGAEAPQDLDAVERLIEIVSADADEADRGRSRWRAYKARGLEIVHHRRAAAGG